MNSLRRNSIAILTARVATAVLWIAATPFVLDRLGAECFGIWALLSAFNGYLLALDLGVGSTMIRFIAAERASGDRRGIAQTLRRGMRLALGLGLFWVLFILITRGWVTRAFHVPAALVPETHDALLVFGLGIFLMYPAQVLMGALQGFERLDLSSLCMGSGVAAQVTALYVGLHAGGRLEAAAWAGVIGQAVAGLIAAVLVRRQLRRVRAGEGSLGPAWRDLLSFGAALQLTGLLVVFHVQLGKIILGLLGNLSQVADYEVAFRVGSGVGAVPILILAAVVPTVSHAWESEGPAAVTTILTSTLRWIYSSSVVVLGLLWLVAPDITRVWLGPERDRIAGLIRLWAVACAASFVWSPGAAVARGIGKPWIEVWSLFASVLANVGFCAWLVPRFGAAGAVAALGASYGAGFLVFVATSHRSGIAFAPRITRELAPRLVGAWVAVGLVAWLFAAQPLARYLPPLGWIHGALVALTFLALFALIFAPLGDTMRLSRTAWQIAAGALTRPRGSPVAGGP